LTQKVLADLIDRRARQLSDADELDRRVEQRARELAQRLYLDRGLSEAQELLGTATSAENSVDPTGTSSIDTSGSITDLLPSGLTRDELGRPWRRREDQRRTLGGPAS
jgi:uncharacterized protein with von Willebrand factor type A (vWA) domain